MKIPFLKTNGKYSLIDLENNEIKKREYDILDFFYNGYAKVFSDGRWNYIDENENLLQLEHQYDNVMDFIDGLAAVKRNGLWWVINRNGVEISKRGYNEYHRYQIEFIQVTTGFHYLSTFDDYNGDVERCVGEPLDGLLDNKGFEVVPPIEECDINLANDFILLRNGDGYQALNFNGGKIRTLKEY